MLCNYRRLDCMPYSLKIPSDTARCSESTKSGVVWRITRIMPIQLAGPMGTAARIGKAI